MHESNVGERILSAIRLEAVQSGDAEKILLLEEAILNKLINS